MISWVAIFPSTGRSDIVSQERTDIRFSSRPRVPSDWMCMSTSRPIMIVEDSPEDYEATLRAINRSDCDVEVVRAERGDDASTMLQQTQTPGQLPLFALLDLNLPGLDGRAVLQKIRESDRLLNLPVIILTTWALSSEVEFCYAHVANAFVTKDLSFDTYCQKIGELMAFWTHAAKLPELRR